VINTSPGSHLRSTIVDIGLTFCRQFLTGLIQLALVLIVTHLLGAEGAGGYAVALLLPTFMGQLFNLGLGTASIFFVASGQFSLEVAWAATRNAILGMTVFGIVFGASLLSTVSDQLFPGISISVLSIGLAIYPSLLIVTIISSFLQAVQDFRAFNITVLVQPFSSFIGVLSVWSIGSVSLVSVILIVSAAHFLSMVVAIFILNKKVDIFVRSDGKKAYMRKAVIYGYKSYLSNILSFLSYRLDLFLLNILIGPSAVGVYSIAVRLVEQLWMISQAVSIVIFPRLSAMNDDEELRAKFTAFMSRIVLWTTLVSAVLLAVLSRPLIALLFGLEFMAAYYALLVLLPGVVLFSCARVLANDLAARGRVGINLALAGLVITVNAIANILLIPFYGIVGAAMATSLSYIINLLVRLVLQNFSAEVSLREFLLPMPEDFAKVKKLLIRRTR